MLLTSSLRHQSDDERWPDSKLNPCQIRRREVRDELAYDGSDRGRSGRPSDSPHHVKGQEELNGLSDTIGVTHNARRAGAEGFCRNVPETARAGVPDVLSNQAH